jgi:hypothetical protein
MKGIFVALSCIAWAAHAAEPPACTGEKRLACEAARAALVAAEAAVAEAARREALWTTAQSALQDAEAAFAGGDYDAVARAAESAEQLARLGIAQTRYPPLPAPKP